LLRDEREAPDEPPGYTFIIAAAGFVPGEGKPRPYKITRSSPRLAGRHTIRIGAIIGSIRQTPRGIETNYVWMLFANIYLD